MNLTQALALSSGYCPTSSDVCDRCGNPTTLTFNWHMVETLCMACFIEALYEHNDTFPQYLKWADGHPQLLQLCQAYQLQGRYFPHGPDDEPALFFEIDIPTEPTYRTRGDTPMNVTQHSFITVAQQQREHESAKQTPKPVTIRELPPQERPVNRLQRYGAGSLSNAEIIAAIIQTPNALHQACWLLAEHDGLLGLTRTSIHELAEAPGLGPAKAAQIKAAMELGRRVLIASPKDRVQVKSPADAANLMMMEMSTLEQEHMRLILLDSKNYVIATPTMYVGSLNTSVIRVGELFREAIRQNCAAVIVVHNHPSGDPTPSPEDVSVTELITQAGQLLDIDVLDHLICGRQNYVSLKERGLGFR